MEEVWSIRRKGKGECRRPQNTSCCPRKIFSLYRPVFHRIEISPKLFSAAFSQVQHSPLLTIYCTVQCVAGKGVLGCVGDQIHSIQNCLTTSRQNLGRGGRQKNKQLLKVLFQVTFYKSYPSTVRGIGAPVCGNRFVRVYDCISLYFTASLQSWGRVGGVSEVLSSALPAFHRGLEVAMNRPSI
jgi:hypothetical protein